MGGKLATLQQVALSSQACYASCASKEVMERLNKYKCANCKELATCVIPYKCHLNRVIFGEQDCQIFLKVC